MANRDSTPIRDCAHCGEPFKAVQEYSTFKRKFCSPQCANASRRKRKLISCKLCGKEFEVSQSRFAAGRKYCSSKCYQQDPQIKRGPKKQISDEWNESRRGKGNPAFKHGLYGNRARRSAFSLKLKGESCCRVCGSAEQLHLHHMVPRSKAVKGRDELLNGMPLCNSCHMSWHRRGSVVVYRDLMTEAEWEFVQTIAEPSWLDDRYPDRGLDFRDPDMERIFD